MKTKRLTMDVDYHDLSWRHKGEPSDLEQLFDHMQEAGFDATIWDAFWCGTALYHSKHLPVFANAGGWATPINLANTLKQWDPLSCAIKLGNERNIQVLPYFRLLEEAYAPFDGNEFFRKHPEYWWQTRCGMYRIVGWPCYNYPEVREHMLERVKDLVEHGVRGAFFDMTRSHIPYFVPYRWGDGNGFGFNKPVVEEFKRRHGVDLSKFDYVEDVATADHGGLPFTYERRWVGAEPYDMWAFRRLLGEGFDLFLRKVRRQYPDFYIAVQAGALQAGGRPDEPIHEAICRIDLEGLCADKVVNEFSVSMNYRTSDLDASLLPRFQHVIDSGRQLTAWLNDMFISDGGGGPKASLKEVSAYVDRFLKSSVNGAIIHEALFLMDRDDAELVWQQLSLLKNTP